MDKQTRLAMITFSNTIDTPTMVTLDDKMFTDKNKTYNWLKKQATRPPCNYRLVDRLLNERERGNLRSTVRCSTGFGSCRKNDPRAPLYSTARLGLGLLGLVRKNDPPAPLYSTTRLGLGLWLVCKSYSCELCERSLISTEIIHKLTLTPTPTLTLL